MNVSHTDITSFQQEIKLHRAHYYFKLLDANLKSCSERTTGMNAILKQTKTTYFSPCFSLTFH